MLHRPCQILHIILLSPVKPPVGLIYKQAELKQEWEYWLLKASITCHVKVRATNENEPMSHFKAQASGTQWSEGQLQGNTIWRHVPSLLPDCFCADGAKSFEVQVKCNYIYCPLCVCVCVCAYATLPYSAQTDSTPCSKNNSLENQ